MHDSEAQRNSARNPLQILILKGGKDSCGSAAFCLYATKKDQEPDTESSVFLYALAATHSEPLQIRYAARPCNVAAINILFFCLSRELSRHIEDCSMSSKAEISWSLNLNGGRSRWAFLGYTYPLGAEAW